MICISEFPNSKCSPNQTYVDVSDLNLSVLCGYCMTNVKWILVASGKVRLQIFWEVLGQYVWADLNYSHIYHRVLVYQILLDLEETNNWSLWVSRTPRHQVWTCQESIAWLKITIAGVHVHKYWTGIVAKLVVQMPCLGSSVPTSNKPYKHFKNH